MRSNGFFRVLSFFTFLVLVSFSFLVAQVITADIAGTITDKEGAPLPGVTVTLQNVDTGFSRSVQSGTDGRYSFRSIPTQGRYTIQAELPGFNTHLLTGLTFRPNEAYTTNIVMDVSEIAETITVEAEIPIVDTKRATVQQAITEELIETLPVLGRNYIQLTHLAPGVTGSDYWPTTSGQHYWAMNYIVDGGSNFSKWRSAARTFYSGYSMETIKEIQLMTNQFSVEFGEGMSAINSAVTKSGTNVVGGSIYLYERPGKWDSVDFLTKTKAPFDQQQIGFTLGGPLKKDRTHFFLSYEYRRQRSFNTVTAPQFFGQTVPNDQDQHMAFLKIDHQLSQKDYLSLRYSNDIFDWRNEYGGLNIPGEGDTYVTYVHTGNVGWVKTISENSVNELRFQVASYYDLRKALTSFPGQPSEQRTAWATTGGSSFYGDGFGVTPELTWELFEKYTFARKNHFFKFGGFFKYISAEQIMNPYPYGLYYFAGSPDQYPNPFLYIQGFALDPSLNTVNSKDFVGALFFEDEWSVNNNLALTLGLRWDIEKIWNVKGYNAPVDWKKIQPRMGAAFDIFGNGKSVLRAGFGTFSQQHLSYHFTRGAFFGPEGLVYLTLSPTDQLFPTYPNSLPSFPPGATLPPRDIWEIDENLKNPYSVQATIGYQQEILPRLSVGIDAVYMTVIDGFSVLDINAPESTTEARTRTEADATRPTTPVPNGFRTIQRLGNESRSWYSALNFKLERRDINYSFLLTYTYSKTSDMLNPWSLPQDSRNIEDDKGPGAQHRPHLLKLAFFVRSPSKNIILKDWQFSGIAQAYSGIPYTETYGIDLYGTGLTNARPYGRNNLRGEPYYNLDLSISRKLKITQVNAEIKLDVFNVFNIENYTSYYGARTAGVRFMQPAATAPARRFQIGFVLRF
ncbi:MAG: carboxypeptidase regulatory-like domain-containing protein [Acidobacteriota bacterium]|nr:carboxypeptidase regulatory-like domain-containing protein [Acidobacteriota bacterium]